MPHDTEISSHLRKSHLKHQPLQLTPNCKYSKIHTNGRREIRYFLWEELRESKVESQRGDLKT